MLQTSQHLHSSDTIIKDKVKLSK